MRSKPEINLICKLRIAGAIYKTNDAYGEFTVVPALMMNMQDTIIKRVPFGGTKDLKLLYSQYANI